MKVEGYRLIDHDEDRVSHPEPIFNDESIAVHITHHPLTRLSSVLRPEIVLKPVPFHLGFD